MLHIHGLHQLHRRERHGECACGGEGISAFYAKMSLENCVQLTFKHYLVNNNRGRLEFEVIWQKRGKTNEVLGPRTSNFITCGANAHASC